MIATVMFLHPSKSGLSIYETDVLFALWFWFAAAVCMTALTVKVISIPALRVYRRLVQAWLYPTLISLNVYDWIVSKLGFGVKENS